MRKCEYCRSDVEGGDNWCTVCGCNLWLQTSHLSAEWRRGLEEGNNLHWLAQCQRRLELPIESTEEIPFVAFEYGWKVLNRLYNSLSIPKVFDPEIGRMRERTQKECLLYLFREENVTRAVIDETRPLIRSVCDCVLETSDQGYVDGKRGYITFEDVSEAEAVELRHSTMEKCGRLIRALEANDYEDAATALVEMLVAVRNARVHANVTKPAKLPVGGKNESVQVKRSNPKESSELTLGRPLVSLQRHHYEIYAVARILLIIGKVVIAAKTRKSLAEIDALVTSRMAQLAMEIYQYVKSWEPDPTALPRG